MPTWSTLFTQDSASPLMEQLIFFHDHAMLILILITIVIAYMMPALLVSPFMNRFLYAGQEVETVWTILPAITLIFIALPSLRLLYLLDEINSPSMTIKTIGHQWYWSYEYSDFLTAQFDSYMIPTEELPKNGFRLLDVDNRTIIPMNTQIRMLITAADVLHSWTIPSMGVKADAVPGRLNQTSFMVSRPGLFTGQCSEICGANHSFMPIMLESTTVPMFSKWIKSL
uniref:Cytochrome c oxidase subunit 2 n=1 Tax=Mecistocephalus marmoratus TaxID=980230 RepID=A0A4Y1K7P1_9MYRI|nr:cytochrome c oxidase subunit II [Mecistocephalus marmoratus]ARU77306.1 cytochrome c oxidase subunit II [Mecistocephalus marmoratus]